MKVKVLYTFYGQPEMWLMENMSQISLILYCMAA